MTNYSHYRLRDEKCTSLTAMLRRGKLDPLVYSMNDGVLHRRVVEGGQTFQAIYVPEDATRFNRVHTESCS